LWEIFFRSHSKLLFRRRTLPKVIVKAISMIFTIITRRISILINCTIIFFKFSIFLATITLWNQCLIYSSFDLLNQEFRKSFILKNTILSRSNILAVRMSKTITFRTFYLHFLLRKYLVIFQDNSTTVHHLMTCLFTPTACIFLPQNTNWTTRSIVIILPTLKAYLLPTIRP